MMSKQQLSVKLSDKDKLILSDLVRTQFANMYRMTSDDMSWAERLIFNKIYEYVTTGFYMQLDELVDDE